MSIFEKKDDLFWDEKIILNTQMLPYFKIIPFICVKIGFPHLWVNGEKYVFSSEVLEAGQKLL
jgi:hypothetical protein